MLVVQDLSTRSRVNPFQIEVQFKFCRHGHRASDVTASATQPGGLRRRRAWARARQLWKSLFLGHRVQVLAMRYTGRHGQYHFLICSSRGGSQA